MNWTEQQLQRLPLQTISYAFLWKENWGLPRYLQFYESFTNYLSEHITQRRISKSKGVLSLRKWLRGWLLNPSADLMAQKELQYFLMNQKSYRPRQTLLSLKIGPLFFCRFRIYDEFNFFELSMMILFNTKKNAVISKIAPNKQC